MESLDHRLRIANKRLTFKKDEPIHLKFQISRDIYPEHVSFKLYDDSGDISLEEINDFYLEDEFICFEIEIELKQIGIFFFQLTVKEGNDILNLSEQLLIYEKRNKANLFGDGIVYHIFVDRFYKYGRTKKRDDAVYIDDWYSGEPEYAENPGDFLPNNSFFGGTIDGITKKLDYIASLGTKCIYLSPIFEAYSNHKYDAGDFLKVDVGFGGEKALKDLVEKADAMGIRVILDCAFNHTGDDSVYFNKYGKYKTLGAYQSKDSDYFAWYNFKSHPDDYECWWGVKVLPRTVRTESYRKFICDEVLPKYLSMGIGGVRLDVVDELEDDFVEQISKAVKSYGEDRIVIGEVWEDASNKISYGKRKRYFHGTELDGVTNYPLRDGIIDFIKTRNNKKLTETLTMLLLHYPEHSLSNSLNFLGSHDTERIITVLGGENGEGKTGSELVSLKMNTEEYEKAVKLLKSALILVLTLPGTPCIYYGDEVGMEGYRDPFNRRPFPWGKEDDNLLSFVRIINNSGIKSEFRQLESSNTSFVYSVGDDFICAVNMSMSDENVNIDGKHRNIMDGSLYDDVLSVPPCSGIIVKKIKE
ncbi:MAG: glycoside hydrolase family 13 protein [Eubacteriales bacterium]|nr:glycoside hydrolase family 13 protein [Eubacteriales bacterium]MDD4475578.1 glycoside hydrolase family 13 protein [Eubacteriales bacterium]